MKHLKKRASPECKRYGYFVFCMVLAARVDKFAELQ